jgi:hypothetical protein
MRRRGLVTDIGIIGHLLQAVLQREYFSWCFAVLLTMAEADNLFFRCAFPATAEARTRESTETTSARSGRLRTQSRVEMV